MLSRLTQWGTGFYGKDGVSVYQRFFILRYISSLLISVAIVRSPLQMEDISAFELFLFFSMALSAFWSNGIKNALLARYNEESLQKEHLFLATFLLLQILALVVCLFLYFLGETFLPQLTADTFFLGNPWFYLYVCFSPVLILTENLLYLEQKYRSLEQYGLWSSIGSFMVISLIAWFFPDIEIIFVALCVIAVIRYVYLLFILPFRSLSGQVVTMLGPYFLFCLPLIITMLLGSAMEMVDGFLVVHYFSPDQFPVYRYGAREIPFSAMVFASLGSALIPVVQKERQNHESIKVRVAAYMDVFFPISIAAVLVSYPAFSFIYGETFAASGHIFALYLLIIASRCWMPQIYPQALHQHRILIASSVIELVANILLSLWWVSLWGVYGLVGATVVAYAVQKGILMIYNWRVNHILPGDYMPLRKYTIYLVLLLVAVMVSFYLYA